MAVAGISDGLLLLPMAIIAPFMPLLVILLADKVWDRPNVTGTERSSLLVIWVISLLGVAGLGVVLTRHLSDPLAGAYIFCSLVFGTISATGFTDVLTRRKPWAN